ncbi:hypothetical protein KQX54_012944 [Cotesia glomerata]|uniref:Uncharacterized protein n=1 Tax=Cotesia glomerata TaxID=32391 RepID=A0AAV7I258_COTGL|nr:hypothetical protein KQX54_012944 [Cotesia glomerata]
MQVIVSMSDDKPQKPYHLRGQGPPPYSEGLPAPTKPRKFKFTEPTGDSGLGDTLALPEISDDEDDFLVPGSPTSGSRETTPALQPSTSGLPKILLDLPPETQNPQNAPEVQPEAPIIQNPQNAPEVQPEAPIIQNLQNAPVQPEAPIVQIPQNALEIQTRAASL